LFASSKRYGAGTDPLSNLESGAEPVELGLNDHVAVQQTLIRKQDEQLDTVLGTIGILKQQGFTIGRELDDQAVYA